MNPPWKYSNPPKRYPTFSSERKLTAVNTPYLSVIMDTVIRPAIRCCIPIQYDYYTPIYDTKTDRITVLLCQKYGPYRSTWVVQYIMSDLKVEFNFTTLFSSVEISILQFYFEN